MLVVPRLHAVLLLHGIVILAPDTATNKIQVLICGLIFGLSCFRPREAAYIRVHSSTRVRTGTDVLLEYTVYVHVH